MTNRAAIITAILLLAVFLADGLYLQWNIPKFLGMQLIDLIDYLAFWR